MGVGGRSDFLSQTSEIYNANKNTKLSLEDNNGEYQFSYSVTLNDNLGPTRDMVNIKNLSSIKGKFTIFGKSPTESESKSRALLPVDALETPPTLKRHIVEGGITVGKDQGENKISKQICFNPNAPGLMYLKTEVDFKTIYDQVIKETCGEAKECLGTPKNIDNAPPIVLHFGSGTDPSGLKTSKVLRTYYGNRYIFNYREEKQMKLSIRVDRTMQKECDIVLGSVFFASTLVEFSEGNVNFGPNLGNPLKLAGDNGQDDSSSASDDGIKHSGKLFLIFITVLSMALTILVLYGIYLYCAYVWKSK